MAEPDQGHEARRGPTKDFEDVSGYTLAAEREAELLTTQTECTFMWTTASGAPIGVIMNFVWHDGRFWLTATRRRKRIAAIETRPAVAVAVSSRGTDIGTSQSLTYQGTAIVHEDPQVAAWFYPALAARVRPDSEEQQAAFVAHLSSPGRVVIEVVPGERLGFDASAMFADSAAGPSRTRV
jgi:hypothetical protein